MKIQDLPPRIKELALKRQEEAGNRHNPYEEISTLGTEGGFDWHTTPEGLGFWTDIEGGNFQPFYDLYGPDETIETTAFGESLRAIESLISKEPTFGTWVPIEDSEPSQSTILISYQYGTAECRYKGGKYMTQNCSAEFPGVTAWMPLPPKYEPKSK